MGKQPLMALASVCLAGVALCGCQQDKPHTLGRGWNNTGATQIPPSQMSSNGTTGTTGWDSTPQRNLASRPGGAGWGNSTTGSGLGSGTGTGLGTGTGSGLATGTGSGVGSSDLTGGMRQPAGGFGGSSNTGLTQSGGFKDSPGFRSPPTPMGTTTGLPAGASDPRLADPPPSSGSLTGNMSGPSLGNNGLSNSLTPPPPPAAARPAPAGSLNLGGDTPPASPPGMNQSNMTGGYRTTVPPGLGDSTMPPPPTPPGSVPTMNSNRLEP